MRAAVRLCILTFALLSMRPDGVDAWETDVHYGLTKWLAMKASLIGLMQSHATKNLIVNARYGQFEERGSSVPHNVA